MSVISPRIGKPLQLQDRVGIRLEGFGHVLELVHVLVSDFGPIRVEVDGSRLLQSELVAVRESLREPGFGIKRSDRPRLCVAREHAHLVDRLAACPGASRGFTQLRLLSVGPLGELGLRRAQLRLDKALRRAAGVEHGEAAAED